jgi:hypothetical protein
MRARLLPLLAVLACDRAGGSAFVSTDGVDFERAQVVVLDADGALVRAWPPLTRGPDGRVEGGAAQVTLPPGGRAFLLAFDDAELVALEPRWRRSALDAVTVVAPDASRPPTDEALELRDHPVPPDVRAHPVDPGSASLLEPATVRALGLEGALALRLRRDPCRPPSLSPFVPWHRDGPRPLGGPAVELGEVSRLVRLDERRLLVVHTLGLVLVERDRPVDPERDVLTRASLTPAEDRGLTWYPTAVAPGPVDPGGRRELLVVVEAGGDLDGDDRGAVLRAWVGPRGLELDPGAPLLAPPLHLGGVATDGEGRAVVGGVDGSVWLRPDPAGAFGAPTFPGDIRRRYRMVVSGSADPEASLLAATADHLHRWHPLLDRWSTLEIPRAVLGRGFDALAVRADPEGAHEVWLAGEFGALAVAGPREIAAIPPPELPLAVASCGAGQALAGRVTNGGDWVDVELAGAHALLAAYECPGVVFLRRADGCAHFEPAPASGPGGARAVVDVEVRSAGEGAREATVLTSDGALRVATWEDR